MPEPAVDKTVYELGRDQWWDDRFWRTPTIEERASRVRRPRGQFLPTEGLTLANDGTWRLRRSTGREHTLSVRAAAKVLHVKEEFLRAWLSQTQFPISSVSDGIISRLFHWLYSKWSRLVTSFGTPLQARRPTRRKQRLTGKKAPSKRNKTVKSSTPLDENLFPQERSKTWGSGQTRKPGSHAENRGHR